MTPRRPDLSRSPISTRPPRLWRRAISSLSGRSPRSTSTPAARIITPLSACAISMSSAISARLASNSGFEPGRLTTSGATPPAPVYFQSAKFRAPGHGLRNRSDSAIAASWYQAPPHVAAPASNISDFCFGIALAPSPKRARAPGGGNWRIWAVCRRFCAFMGKNPSILAPGIVRAGLLAPILAFFRSRRSDRENFSILERYCNALKNYCTATFVLLCGKNPSRVRPNVADSEHGTPNASTDRTQGDLEGSGGGGVSPAGRINDERTR